MKAYEVINSTIKSRGIKLSHLAQRTGISYELLRRSMIGTRKLPADEFLVLCDELGIDLAQFRAS